MVSFGNFAMTVNLCGGSHLGTLYGYFFTQTFDQFEFSLRTSNKTCLNILLSYYTNKMNNSMVDNLGSVKLAQVEVSYYAINWLGFV